MPRLIPVYRHHFVVSGTPAGQPVLGVADPCRAFNCKAPRLPAGPFRTIRCYAEVIIIVSALAGNS